jgi:hypothetical protein
VNFEFTLRFLSVSARVMPMGFNCTLFFFGADDWSDLLGHSASEMNSRSGTVGPQRSAGR